MRKPTMSIFLPGNFEKGDRTIGDIAVPRGYERIAVGTRTCTLLTMPDMSIGIMVDVARNPKTGKKLFMLVEGNTPAVEFHVLANPLSPRLSPWFALDETAEVLYFSIFKYYKGELRYFE